MATIVRLSNLYRRIQLTVRKAPPADIAAVQIGGISYIFFVDSSGCIAYYHGGSVVELQSGALYNKVDRIMVPIDADGNVGPVRVNANNKDIAAIAYKVCNSKQIRVYYIDSKNTVKEICWSNGNNQIWSTGELGKKKIFAVVEGSSISANVMEEGEKTYLKVFCNGRDTEGHLMCLFRQTDHNVWAEATLTGLQHHTPNVF
ncbi:hypothetical protein GGR58DRAFT_501570 [Xylaria digitata]|nr:hypothetical protein GGR58DRAFT_501570 [Xylaria digitata]